VLSGFPREWLEPDGAIADGWIAGLGEYEGRETIDAGGRFVVPGFIDAHMHLESTKLLPDEFARLVLPLGTTAVVADPHEIANVLGADGVHWLVDFCAELPLDVYFMAPSCVPAAPFASARSPLPDAARASRVALAPLVQEFGPSQIAFCTDDRDPDDIVDDGHINGMVRKAVAAGVAPADAIVCASFNSARWHGLSHLGALAPGYQADVLVLPDLETFRPELVLKAGRRLADFARPDVPEWVQQSVRIAPLASDAFAVPECDRVRAIGLVPDQVVTESLVVDRNAPGLAK